MTKIAPGKVLRAAGRHQVESEFTAKGTVVEVVKTPLFILGRVNRAIIPAGVRWDKHRLDTMCQLDDIL
jgi:hypothetical protein